MVSTFWILLLFEYTMKFFLTEVFLFLSLIWGLSNILLLYRCSSCSFNSVQDECLLFTIPYSNVSLFFGHSVVHIVLYFSGNNLLS